MGEVYSKYRRKQNNIDKAVDNEEVAQYLKQHYYYLHSLLVRKEEDEDTFNDTYLKLTYNYNPDKDFIEQFKYFFRLLKGAYYRDNKVENYHLNRLEGIDIADKPEEDSPSVQKIDLTELKTKIQNFANFKEARKTAYQKD